MPPPGIPDIFILDEQKIQPSENTEKQELYVLQWLAQIERESKTMDAVRTLRTINLRDTYIKWDSSLD